MNNYTPGEKLLRSLSWNGDIILVSPFIKYLSLEKVFKNIDLKNRSIKIFTRWRYDEILKGVSDIEIWNIIRNYHNIELYLCNILHAKIYCIGNITLIGSANLTDMGMGWSQRSNIEVLVETEFNEIIETLKLISRESILVNNEIFEKFNNIINDLREDSNIILNEKTEQVIFNIDKWKPNLRNPELLYDMYCDEIKNIPEYLIIEGKEIINLFDPPKNLSKQLFKNYIGLLFLQCRIVKEIDNFIVYKKRFGEVINYLRNIDSNKHSRNYYNELWQVIFRWLIYFLPDKYELVSPSHSEIIIKKY